MGGVRCTFRNCTIKSDGKTHMFHYPVFEKIRCYHWLRNAHRLDFLHLKVSQLKNRVICQYHFNDNYFMNFKKDKLTFDAIPTKDGPYCDPTNNDYVESSQNSSKLLSIIADDIEDEIITGKEKKMNYFSTKYGDFLTNIDFMNIVKIDEDNTNCNHIESCLDILPPQKILKDNLLQDDVSFSFKSPTTDKIGFAVSPSINSGMLMQNEICNSQQSRKCHIPENAKENIELSNTVEIELTQQQSLIPPKKKPKIRIISEKKITDPLPICGKYFPVSPNCMLNVLKIKTDIGEESLNEKSTNEKIDGESDTQINNKIEIELVPQEEIQPKESLLLPQKSPPPPIDRLQSDISDKPCLKKSLSKPKTKERVEVLSKRKRLRDMVESCLDKLENCDKKSEEAKSEEYPKVNKRKDQLSSSSDKKRELSAQEYTIAFLEARIRKMENTLLEKIDQNSKQITDLKKTFGKGQPKKKTCEVVKIDEETHKKQLFHDISKFLSPSSKSLIYEELFLNKFACGDTKKRSKRKRQI